MNPKLPQIQAKIREDQPPASKGEGWKERLKDMMGSYGAAFHSGDIRMGHLHGALLTLIQAAIDEAVEAKENEWQKLFDNDFQKLKDALPKSTIRLNDCIGKIVPGPNENRVV